MTIAAIARLLTGKHAPWGLLLASLCAIGCQSGNTPRGWQALEIPACVEQAEKKLAKREPCLAVSLERAPRATLDDARAQYRATKSPVVARDLATIYLELGQTAEENDRRQAVDHYFHAAIYAWLGQRGVAGTECHSGECRIYHVAVGKWIEAAVRFGRYDPVQGVEVEIGCERRRIPVRHEGFVWQPADFHKLVVVGEYDGNNFDHVRRRTGFGVPVVAVRTAKRIQRPAEDFLPVTAAFAATAALYPTCGEGFDPFDELATCAAGTEPPFEFVLYDPLRVYTANTPLGPRKLAGDITAPFAYKLATTQRDYVREFLEPGRSVREARLITLEPYQAGKIPLVFVHGLLSDSLTWVYLANEMQSHPEFVSRYQIWAFQYPTGDSFLYSAHQLREQLRAAMETFDPGCDDPALHNMVVVGHSMGGLIAKLQITSSGNRLWEAVANRPFEEIRADEKARERLQNSFFFEPQPFVKRVVFIATPHDGSGWARSGVGRLGSFLVAPAQLVERQRTQLIQDNPGVFAPEVTRRMPTSVDLLEPNSPILDVIRELPIAPDVALHSVIGRFRPMLGAGPSDGIVPVASATHPFVESELTIRSRHADVHHHDETALELWRILVEHESRFGTPTEGGRAPMVEILPGWLDGPGAVSVEQDSAVIEPLPELTPPFPLDLPASGDASTVFAPHDPAAPALAFPASD